MDDGVDHLNLISRPDLYKRHQRFLSQPGMPDEWMWVVCSRCKTPVNAQIDKCHKCGAPKPYVYRGEL